MRPSFLSSLSKLFALYAVSGAAVVTVAIVGVFFVPSHGDSASSFYWIVIPAILAGNAAWVWLDTRLARLKQTSVMVLTAGFSPTPQKTSGDANQFLVPSQLLIAASVSGMIMVSSPTVQAGASYSSHVLKW